MDMTGIGATIRRNFLPFDRFGRMQAGCFEEGQRGAARSTLKWDPEERDGTTPDPIQG